MKEEKYNLWDTYLKDKKIKIHGGNYNDFTQTYHHTLPRKHVLTDEQKLDKIELSVIEKYLRKKKLLNLKKDE